MELRDRLVSIDPTFDKSLTFPLPLPTPATVPDLSNAPNLEKIFTQVAGGGLKFDFQGSVSNTPGVAKHVSQTPDNHTEVRKLTFGERLFEMIDDSDNAASQSCVEDIGYLFINSCLWQCDFFNPQRQGGLWIGSAFLDKKARWIETPVPDKNQGPGNSFTACTPATIAAIMTLIAQDRMISPEASQEMRALLNKRKTNPRNGSHSRSFLEDGLVFADPARETGRRFRLLEVFSKLGIGTRRSDAIIVKREERGKTLHYVAAGFDDVPSAAGLHELALQLDMAIQKNNGRQPSPVPLP